MPKKGNRKRSPDKDPSKESPQPTPAPKATQESGPNPADLAAEEAPVTTFGRYFSFALLLGVIVLVVILLYAVLASFLIPLFLAAILVVIFRPLHRWMQERCGPRPKLAALLTTISVMLVVLLPMGALLVLAAAEGRQVVRQLNTVQLQGNLQQLRTKLGLDLPRPIVKVDNEIQRLFEEVTLSGETEDRHRTGLFEIESAAQELSKQAGLPWPEAPQPPPAEGDDEIDEGAAATDDPQTPALSSDMSEWVSFVTLREGARERHDQMSWRPVDSDEENRQRVNALHDYQQQLTEMADAFSQFKVNWLGGKTRTWLKELVNPSPAETDQYVRSAVELIRDTLLSWGGKGAVYLGSLLIGTAIMIIGLYFFLLDGPRMIEAFKVLSPLEDEHEQELVAEFGNVSRAVVVAILLSAVVQGILAGIGFYFAGLDSVFLLTVLTAVLAMVPFVGAAAVWVPCCLYLYFVTDQWGGAIGLAIYGTAIISTADNVIKPLVLHGHSNLHPLFALLSVLGGVAALGPIGILVGPMAIVFLQTLLKILQRELLTLGRSDGGASGVAPSS